MARARKRPKKFMEVFTTGEAARIAKVSQQTIIRCFDNGTLKGYRVPGSRFRRIPRASLRKFLRDNLIPLGELAESDSLLVADDSSFGDIIEVAGAKGLVLRDSEPRIELAVKRVKLTFDLGFESGGAYRAIFIGSLEGLTVADALQAIRTKRNEDETHIILGRPANELAAIEALKIAGVTTIPTDRLSPEAVYAELLALY